MKHFGLLIVAFSVFNCQQKTTPLYVGTYTDGKSEGIYRFEFDCSSGTLTNKELAASSDNPSFITFSPDKKHLFAVNETEDGFVSAFNVDPVKGLSIINKVSTQGAHPCHIAINKTGDMAAVSNYTGGNFSLHKIKPNGFLNEAFQVINHKTDSTASHAHSTQFFNDNLYASDLGLNAVFNYQLTNGKYDLLSPSIVPLKNNSGPRHFSITKEGRFIYIINELSSTITVAKKTKKEFQLIETYSTLDTNFKEKSYCADIHLSADEEYLYGSNRGENSIAVFKRDTITGKLTKVQNSSVHGDWPRNFTIDPSGRFLLVANQKSHNISVFKIDTDSGKLTFLNSVDLPSPVCLLF